MKMAALELHSAVLYLKWEFNISMFIVAATVV